MPAPITHPRRASRRRAAGAAVCAPPRTTAVVCGPNPPHTATNCNGNARHREANRTERTRPYHAPRIMTATRIEGGRHGQGDEGVRGTLLSRRRARPEDHAAGGAGRDGRRRLHVLSARTLRGCEA